MPSATATATTAKQSTPTAREPPDGTAGLSPPAPAAARGAESRTPSANTAGRPGTEHQTGDEHLPGSLGEQLHMSTSSDARGDGLGGGGTATGSGHSSLTLSALDRRAPRAQYMNHGEGDEDARRRRCRRRARRRALPIHHMTAPTSAGGRQRDAARPRPSGRRPAQRTAAPGLPTPVPRIEPVATCVVDSAKPRWLEARMTAADGATRRPCPAAGRSRPGPCPGCG